MLQLFRIASLLEGCSYLLILTASFGIISRDFVFPIGMGHGVLFLSYFVLSLLASHKQGWSVGFWLLMLLAAIVPFAFVPVESFLQKALREDGIRTAPAA